MTRWMTVSLEGSSLGLALLLGSCGSMDPAGAGQIELQATAQANINGIQAELKGQFRIEAEGQRLRGELDNSGFSMGTAISFCLVKPTGTTPLAAPQTDAQGVAQFELNTQTGQTVPRVNTGDKLEARQGAMSSGTADCSAPLLVSATFQPEVVVNP